MDNVENVLDLSLIRNRILLRYNDPRETVFSFKIYLYPRWPRVHWHPNQKLADRHELNNELKKCITILFISYEV